MRLIDADKFEVYSYTLISSENGYDDEYCCYGERKKGENDE